MTINTSVLPSIHGRRFGITRGSHIAVDGRIVVPSWRDPGARSVLFDHFNGPTMDANKWAVNKGSDGGAANFAVSVAKGGMIRATTGAGATTTMAVNGVQVNGSLNWEADQSGLLFTAAVKLAAITTVALYVGFTDQTAALEMPATLSGGTLTTNYTDGFGFLFDTGATAATWKCVGVANDVDAAILDTGVAPVAATYDLIQMECDANGTATFYLNGNQIGQLTGAVTKTVPLTPVVAGFRRAASSTTIDVDFFHVAQDR